jgi:hypothetical protein
VFAISAFKLFEGGNMKAFWTVVWVFLAVILLVFILDAPDLQHPLPGTGPAPDLPHAATEDKASSPELPFHPNAVAKTLSAVPGAIVCSDFASVGFLFDLYIDHVTETGVDAMTRGQWTLSHGPPATAPDPILYGCSLLPPGTMVEAHNAVLNGVPFVAVVTAKLPDGTMIHGVTFLSMVKGIPSRSSSPETLN